MCMQLSFTILHVQTCSQNNLFLVFYIIGQSCVARSYLRGNKRLLDLQSISAISTIACGQCKSISESQARNQNISSHCTSTFSMVTRNAVTSLENSQRFKHFITEWHNDMEITARLVSCSQTAIFLLHWGGENFPHPNVKGKQRSGYTRLPPAHISICKSTGSEIRQPFGVA